MRFLLCWVPRRHSRGTKEHSRIFYSIFIQMNAALVSLRDFQKQFYSSVTHLNGSVPNLENYFKK